MKFLLDENISQSVAEGLREAGFRIYHILDFDLGGATDEGILVFAKKKKLTIITHDKDFGNLIRFPTQNHYGVIILRFRNQKPQNLLLFLLRFLSDYKDFKSKLVILREDAFRII